MEKEEGGSPYRGKEEGKAVSLTPPQRVLLPGPYLLVFREYFFISRKDLLRLNFS